MKKILYTTSLVILIASVLVFFNQSYAAIVTVDSNTTGTSDGISSLSSLFLHENGQTFTVSANANLTSVQFKLSKSGSPPGNIYAYLFDITGTYGTDSKPTGSALATSDAVSASSLGTGLAYITFTFSGANQYAMQSGHYYAVEILYDQGGASDYVNIQLSTTNHSGNRFYSAINGTWAVFGTNDLFFVVSGEETAGSVVLANPYDTVLFE